MDWGAVLAAQDIRAAGPEAAVLRLKQLVLEQIVAEQIYKQGELR